MRESGGAICFAGFLGICINVLHLVLPLYMLQVYDRVLNSRSYDTLTMLTILAAIALLFYGVLEVIRSRVFMIAGERLFRKLQRPVFEAATAESLRSQTPASAQATRDLQEIRQFLTGGPAGLPFDCLFAPLFLAVLFLLHPAYGLVAAVGLGVLIALSLLMEAVARRRMSSANDAAMQAHQEAANAIRHAEVIEAMGMLPAVVQRWRDRQSRALVMVGNGNGLAKLISVTARTSRMWLQIAMLATGATLAIDGSVSHGSIVAANVIMSRFIYPFEQLIEGWWRWSSATAAFGRLRALFAGHRALRSTTPIEAADGRLAVERVGFVPPETDKPVLRGISFVLESGEVLGVIGPSGAGKSTLARLLVGVWRPTAGRIYLDDHDVYSWERASFGAQVGYLPQAGALLDGTVRENIARMQEGDPAEVIAAAKRAGVHELIGRLPLGYETRIGESGFLLSGGQRQRIALARALFGRPKLVVLDEPNAFLDAGGEQALLEAIRSAKAAGVTIVLIAHKVSMMAAADKLLVLRDGTIEHFGARAEIMRAMSSVALKPVPSSGANVAALTRKRGAPA